jgi:N-acetylneuraminic acid mutarotase
MPLRSRTARAVVVGAAALALAGFTPSTFRTVGWAEVAPAPVYRTEAIGGAVQGRLWVLGGFQPTPFAPTRSVQVFDPATATWTAGPDLPVAISHQAMATDRQFVYLAGGYPARPGGGQDVATTDVFRLDTSTGRWVRLPPLPEARGSGALVFMNRRLYFFGGNDAARQDVGASWSLGIDEPWHWVDLADMPNPRSHLAGVGLGGKLYAVGGQHNYDENAVSQPTVSIYDPTTDQWSPGPDLPQALSHLSAATFAYSNRIITLGGTSGHLHAVRMTYAYTPGAGWVMLSPLPESRYSGVAGVIDGKLYYAGGSRYGGPFQLTTWQGTAVG